MLLAVGYYYVGGPLRRKRGLGPSLTGGQITTFVLSELVLVFSLLSPLDEVGDSYLFSAHMVQHLLLASVWPPLLLLAMPAWMGRALFRVPAVGSLLSFATVPAIALILFNLDIYLWHLPGPYDLTLRNEWVHIGEHLTFMFFGLVNWWPVLSPVPEQRLSYPLQVLYLFVDGMLMMVLGIVFTFSPVVFYSPYAAAPRLWGISALSDQQVGGLIMWYPGNVPYGILLIVAFYKWFEGAPEPGEEARVA